MPKVFRTMLKQDEMPSVGTGSSMLGARILTQERKIIMIFPQMLWETFILILVEFR